MSSEEVIEGPNILETAGWGQNSEKRKVWECFKASRKGVYERVKKISQKSSREKNYLNKKEIMNLEAFSLPLL